MPSRNLAHCVLFLFPKDFLGHVLLIPRCETLLTCVMYLTKNGLVDLPAPRTTELYMKTGEALLLCKAYNGRVTMQWLTEVVAQAAQTEPYKSADDTISVVALAMILEGIQQDLFWKLWNTYCNIYIYIQDTYKLIYDIICLGNY